jgi:rhamnulokinase
MSRFFAACELREEYGRVLLGTLHKDKLTVSEIHRFPNLPVQEKDAVLWDMAQLYQEVLAGLREIGAYNEPVDSISCSAWTGDFLLFHSDASFIPPSHHFSDPRHAAGRRELVAKLSAEEIYEESGIAGLEASTLVQLFAEKAKNLKRADHLMPVADGFNFLLSGVPCIEKSAASATPLFNPVIKDWSGRLLRLVDLRAKLLPTVVPAGTKLKPLRPELVQATALEDAHIVASCSNELAAALAGLPVQESESCAFLCLGRKAKFGTELAEPVIHQGSYATGLSHTLGYNGSVFGHVETLGLRVLEECHQAWAAMDHALDDDVLAHLAATTEPFESLVNFADPRFATPGDLLAKVQSYCKETGQSVPRKPGAIFRCLMESLALLYRRTLDDLAHVTGRDFARVYLLGDTGNNMLNHFIANALQLPLVVAPADATAIGNIVVQALAMGRINSLYEARQTVQQSFKTATVQPHPAGTWAPVYERYLELCGSRTVLAPA